MAQLALITGGAVRIGRAIALHLAKRGFSVAIQYQSSKAEAEATVAEIQALGVRGACFQASLTEHAEVEALLPMVNQAMGRVTCLINNASTFADDRIETLSEESWDKHIAINLKAPVFLAQAFAAQLPAGETGNIVNIIDQRVLRPNPLFFSYTLSKSALWAATKTMAQGLAPGIRVNAIGPGPTLEEFASIRGGFRTRVPLHAARAWHDAGRNRRDCLVHPQFARHDGADDRARWRPASVMANPRYPRYITLDVRHRRYH